jgi:hypothetical protein
LSSEWGLKVFPPLEKMENNFDFFGQKITFLKKIIGTSEDFY